MGDPPELHFTGMAMSAIRRAVYSQAKDVEISQHQSNGAHGIHQARVKLAGDDRLYRLILAPAEAPIQIGESIGGTVHIDDHFAEPLA